MTIYWILFVVPLMGVFSPVRFKGISNWIIWGLWACVITGFIGLRYKVGGDWDNYLQYYERMDRDGAGFIFTSGRSYGFAVINWIASELEWGILGVNVLCGGIFVSGLIYFCRQQPSPWLAWLIATPYLIYVVGMGYTRQSVAIGIIMYGLVFLSNKYIWGFIFSVLIAAIFHNSAIILLILLLALINQEVLKKLIYRIRRPFNAPRQSLVVLATSVLLIVFVFLNLDNFSALIRYYIIGDQWASSGATVRVMMNATAGAMFLLFSKIWYRVYGSSNIWGLISILAIISTPFVFLASTPVDRLSLYLIPLQIYVFSRVHLIIVDPILRGTVIMGVVTVYGLVLWIWLNHASHAYMWVPYRSYLFS